jgi:HEAT repeat protein
MKKVLTVCQLLVAAVVMFSFTAMAQAQSQRSPAPPKDYESLVKRFNIEKKLSYSQRSRTIFAFSNCKDPRALEFLIQVYPAEKDQNARNSILNAIGGFRNSRAFQFLSSRYESEKDANIKRNIVLIVGRIKTEKVAIWLTKIYKKADKGNLKSVAALSLAQMGELLSIETLRELLQNEDANVIKPVAVALGKLGTRETIDVLIEAYAKDWPHEYKKKANGKAHPPQRSQQQPKMHFPGAITAGLAAITDNDTIIWLAEEVLASKEKHYLICLEIIIPLLGTRKEKHAVNNLITILKTSKASIQRLAVLALADIGDKESVPNLIEAGRNQDNVDVKAAIANALGKLADSRGREFLLELVDDKNWEVRAAAVRALGNIPSKKSVNAAIKATKERVWQVQLAGVLALRKLRLKEAIDPLIELVKKTRGRIRMEALEALRDIM